jgi:ankyrin repeat protein/predicted nucleic acid-binding protein
VHPSFHFEVQSISDLILFIGNTSPVFYPSLNIAIKIIFMATQPNNTPDLWQGAIDTLPASVAQVLNTKNTGRRDVALAALKTAEAKRQLALKKRWRIKRSSGQDDIIVRDVLEKVIYWIRRFKEVGDQIVQYDPKHAALPWAAIRFLLQAAINDTTIYSETVENLEKIASFMARSLELERLYIASASALHNQLCDALVKTYAVVLQFLARAVKFFDESAVARLTKAPFRSLHEDDMKDLSTAEAEILKIAGLIDSERLLNLNTQFIRLADYANTTTKAMEEQEYLEILNWLSRVPYSRHYASQQAMRLPCTGKWLVQHMDFRDWEATSSCSSLLLHGIAGCGKTALCTTVVEKYLDDFSKTPTMAPLAYFYCNASDPEPDRRSAEGVLRSLARQLSVCSLPSRQIHQAAIALYQQSIEQAKTDGFEIAKLKISQCVELILAVLVDNPATIVIDALDEVEEPKQLVDALDAIIGRSGNVIKVFMTTRDDPTIFAMVPAAKIIRVTDEYNRSDIRSFTIHTVDRAISEFKLLTGNVTTSLKEKLVESLVSGAEEMFLWVKLQILHLCSFKHEIDVLSAIATMSKPTLEDLYQKSYQRIQQAGNTSHEIAVSVFTWLLYAPELLNTETFLRAVVSMVKIEHVTADTILAIGRGFIILDTQLNVFRFAHGSVRDFLSLQSAYKPDRGQCLLANSCLAICSDFPDHEITEFRPTKSLYGYAALYCGHHFSTALSLGNDSDLVQAIYEFMFDDGEPSLCAKVWIDNVRTAYKSLPLDHAQQLSMEVMSDEQNSPLFAICVFGLSSVLEQNAWPSDCNWNNRNDYGQTYLYAASRAGHTRVVKFLLDQSVDANIQCGRLGSALHCAAYWGHTEVVKLLLKHGANIKIGGKFESAIHAACQGDREDVVLVILDHCTVITDPADYDRVLEAACEAGFLRVLKALEDNTLSHNAKPEKSVLMIKKVIAGGKVASLKYMSRKSAIRLDLFPGIVALSSLHGHEAMTGYLLDQGFDIEEPGELGSSLRCAALHGHGSVCRLLVDRGADVNGNMNFGSALHAAAMKGHAHIAKLLLDSGADANIKGGFYGTPLQAAAYQGHKHVLSILIQRGADVHHGGFSQDAFHAAAEGGHHDIVRFLLDSGFAMLKPFSFPKPVNYQIPPPSPDLLRESSPDGRERIENRKTSYTGEDVSNGGVIDLSNPTPNARAYDPIQEDQKSLYILEAAAALGHIEVVETLLARYEDLGIANPEITQALIAACKHGHQEIVEALLCAIEDDTASFCKALHEAASHGHVSIVSTIMSYNREAQNKSVFFQTALKSSSRSKEGSFHEILSMAQFEISETEKNKILSECLTEAAAGNRGDIVGVILSHNLNFDQHQLIALLKTACGEGYLEVVRSICTFMPYVLSSEEELPICIRLAVKHGCTDVARYLLPHFFKLTKQWHLQSMILVAAGCGYVDILSLFLSSMRDVRWVYDKQLLQQALNVSAENGQENTCKLLLSTGVDPCVLAPAIMWAYAWPDPFPDLFQKEWVSTDSERQTLSEDTQIEESETHLGLALDHPSGAEVNAVESCIFGFERLGHEISRYTFQAEQKLGTGTDQSSVLRLILQHTFSIRNCIRDEAMCAAAELCDASLITMIIEKGANAQAHHGKRSILEYAASRESLCFPVMQTLMRTPEHRDISKAELQHLLSIAISHFNPREGRPAYTKNLFNKTNTLQELFTTGPGALVTFLLRLLPEEEVVGSPGSTFLQYAAAAGAVDSVKLAIDRQVDVNGTSSYYGTALQAASRFGYTSIVKDLLKAKADVDIQRGRHHTALRAAVLGRSLETVNTLLEAGASTELVDHQTYVYYGKDDSTALQLAVERKETTILQALIAAGADTKVLSNQQQPLLIQGCGNGDILLADVLLEAGVDVQAQGHHHPRWEKVCEADGSALHAAIETGNADSISFLLRKGFDSSAEFRELGSLLVTAAKKDDPTILKLLLSRPSNFSNEILIEALCEAVDCSNMQFIDHSLEALESDYGRHASSNTCHQGEANVIELLLDELSSRGQVEFACSAVIKDSRSIRPTAFYTIVEYIPCPVELFLEACFRGYDEIVRLGLEQGMSPTVIDNKGRSALHLAMIHASVAVTKLLLEYGADPTIQHSVYGTPLMAALEGSAVEVDLIFTLPEDAHEHIMLLRDESYLSAYLLQNVPQSRYTQCQHLEDVVRLLIEKGAIPDPTPGPFGSTLTLAAFLGSRNIFDMLLQHGASPSTVGGYLHSPLLASIRANHLKIAKHILALGASKDLGERSDMHALHVASQNTSVRAVKLLLQHGIWPHSKDTKGMTPLHISVGNLARIDRYRLPCPGDVNPDPTQEEIIVHVLLEARPQISITDDIFCAASRIHDDVTRTKILQKMLPRAESHYFPEDAFKSLVKNYKTYDEVGSSFIQKLLNERRIRQITTSMLAVVQYSEMLAKLLDYDPTYKITTQTLDAFSNHRELREVFRILLKRDESIMPSSSHILAVLMEEYLVPDYRSSQDKEIHILEMMFSCNTQLRVTEDMFIAVRHAEDLEVLLAKTTPSEKLVSDAVMASLAKQHRDVSELTKMILSFDHSIMLPLDLANSLVASRGINGLRCVWNHDPGLCIPGKWIRSLIRPGFRREEEGASYADLVELLRKHRAQWRFTRKLREATDHRFSDERDHNVRELFYSLWEYDEEDFSSYKTMEQVVDRSETLELPAIHLESF